MKESWSYSKKKSFIQTYATFLKLNKMIITEIKKGVIGFEMYKNNPVYVYEDCFVIHKTKYSKDINDYISEGNGVLKKYQDKNSLYVYTNGTFEAVKVKYSQPTFFEENVWIEYSYLEDKNANVRFMEHGKEKVFSLKTSNGLHSPRYIKEQSVFLFNDPAQKYLLTCSKNGELMWQYTEEADDLKINWRCIPVVDDVVVVTSEDCAVAEKIQGFNIRTGEKLWEIPNAEEIVCPNTFFVGEDQYLYGCCTECAYYDEESKLIMTKLSPKNGHTESFEVGMGYSVMPYDVTMHGRQLYYADNRRGNEIGVIDVDKREIVERVPLNIKKKVTIGAPVVTDDKVYVFISDLQELRVFEK